MNQQVLKVIANPAKFISRLKIKSKKGKLIKLVPNEEQVQILKALETDEDVLVLKARQIGSSTIMCAYLFWRWFVAEGPEVTAILSHKLASSKHLLAIFKTFYHNLPNYIKEQFPLSGENATSMTLEHNGAEVIAVSAEGHGGLRSFTCRRLIISEFAFAPNADELKATALSALNDGQLLMESTANFFGDALHDEVMRYHRGESDWQYLFFPWFDHSEYCEDVGKTQLTWTLEERDAQEQYNLTDGQLLWRRKKINALGIEKFRREYPASEEEAYSVTGSTFLLASDFEDIEIINAAEYGVNVFVEPEDDDQYAMGVDVSAGVGSDYSSIYVISKKTGQIVLTWRSNTTSPVDLAEVVADIGFQYNYAKILVESNNFGNVVINELKHAGYSNLWKDGKGKDWVTTMRSKTRMFEESRDYVRRGFLQIVDNVLYSELRSITINERGRYELPYLAGSHCDNAVGFSLAVVCLDSVRLKEKMFLPAWVKQSKIERIEQGSGASIGTKRRY